MQKCRTTELVNISSHRNACEQHSFRPAWWLPGGHAQTLWRRFAGASPILRHRERIELSDGDFIDLDWTAQKPDADTNNRAGQTITLIVHGLCGCSESSYVLSLQRKLGWAGMCSAALNLRGCSGEVNRKAKSYHSGVSEDLDEVFTALSIRYPQQDFVIVGYSLGGNVLLKWLAESAAAIGQPVKAVAVSTPFSLAVCSRFMMNGLSQIYGRYFTRRLLSALESKKQHFWSTGAAAELEKLLALGNTATISSIWEFDDKVTAPLHGFIDAEDYYEQCSSIHYLKRINTPTLLIQSQDDPMIPPSALPQPQQLSSSLNFELQCGGGHVGFKAGNGKQWLESRILQYLAVQ